MRADGRLGASGGAAVGTRCEPNGAEKDAKQAER